MPLVRLAWMFTGGLLLSVSIYALGCLFAITIIGIPRRDGAATRTLPPI